MNGPSRLASAPTLPLAPRLGTGLPRRPVRRRVTPRAVVLLAIASLAALAAGRRMNLPRHLSVAIAKVRALSAPPAPIAAARRAASVRVAPRPAESRAASTAARVVASTHAGALFAKHTWYVAPPPKPAPPPPPPPEPTAPPLPFTFLGSYAPQGDAPVYFLSQGDRVIDARVGDKLNGVYQFESAANGQLVFVYLPLNIRQNLSARVSP